MKGGIARLKGLGRRVPKFGFCVLSHVDMSTQSCPESENQRDVMLLKHLLLPLFLNFNVLNLAIWQRQNAAKV